MKLSNKVTIFVLTALTCGSLSAYSLAQPKNQPPGKVASVSDAGAPPSACMHPGMDCPMHGLAALADVKVEKTKSGAVLQISAKDPAKLVQVQALAEQIAEHMKTGDCPMMKGKDGPMHGHMHGEHGKH